MEEMEIRKWDDDPSLQQKFRKKLMVPIGAACLLFCKRLRTSDHYQKNKNKKKKYRQLFIHTKYMYFCILSTDNDFIMIQK